MSALGVAYIIIVFGLAGFFACRARARLLEQRGQKMHSLPLYYGWWAFFVTSAPALLFLLIWTISSNLYLERRAFSHLAAQNAAAQNAASAVAGVAASGAAPAQSAGFGLEKAVLSDLVKNLPALGGNIADYAQASYASVRKKLLTAKNIALVESGRNYMLPLAVEWLETRRILQKTGGAAAIILAAFAFVGSFYYVRPAFRARNKVERVIISTLFLASLLAIATTIGIVLSMLFQTVHFFESVSPRAFFFGTVWDPRFSTAAGEAGATGRFGLVPLLAGTLYIALVAMIVAVPVGLFAAIYMAEYASPGLRSVIKPLLEILAGIPTIVYGFFALMTIGPFLRDISAALAGGQSFIQAQSVLTAGLVMGIMLIPFVSSLSDDIITAVPRALRDGSYGLGATQSETVKKVVLPAALPGIVAALLLAASRAIGETMIVVLAAGVAANISFNPFAPMTTITVKIVNQLTGDLEFDSPQTLVAFALGMTLFVLTLLMNIFALYIVRKYREHYE
ncbi:MAG: phosphate ABC transporter permease subunit PstC [Candidatus Tokpelaia sp.]|nr:MAG: phosphate ABC transporter permease subunit PstC [Candidatus Tokpelaia sp.]KAA6206064.1 MAG: phosphate ABC transporter permease subunit PstC [Candidatus Tokpelaia sp.]